MTTDLMEATGNRALVLSRAPQYIGLRNTALLLLMKLHRDWDRVLSLLSRLSFSLLKRNVPNRHE